MGNEARRQRAFPRLLGNGYAFACAHAADAPFSGGDGCHAKRAASFEGLAPQGGRRATDCRDSFAHGATIAHIARINDAMLPHQQFAPSAGGSGISPTRNGTRASRRACLSSKRCTAPVTEGWIDMLAEIAPAGRTSPVDE